MALARIITRSHQCSRQLAFDLLARGYTVEIVSPDKIPDNIADLELRVDTGPGDRLAATVEAHDGDRSASLEFVHYLKAPMGDFIRRPQEPPEVVRVPEPPACVVTGFSPAGTGQSAVTPRIAEPLAAEMRVAEPPTAEPRVAEPRVADIELPAEAPQLASDIVSTRPSTAVARDFDPEDAAPLTVPQGPVPTPQAEPPSYFAAADSTVARLASALPAVFQAMQSLRRVGRALADRATNRFAGWRWRAALAFASVALLAAVLGFGMGRTGKAAAQGSRAAPVEKVAAASTEMTFMGAADSEKDLVSDPRQASALAPSPSALKSGGNTGHAPKAAPAAKATAPTASHKVGASRAHSDDLIARDTVTYLDKRFEPRPVKKSAAKVKTAKSPARHRPGLRDRGGVIAANKVIYLDKPSPKTAK